jgi:photosystem II stability/assembly factor-like uncharacterized protein
MTNHHCARISPGSSPPGRLRPTPAYRLSSTPTPVLRLPRRHIIARRLLAERGKLRRLRVGGQLALLGWLVVPALALAAGGWHIISGAPRVTGGGGGIACLHGTDCWTTGGGAVYASTNGGRSWRRQRVPQGDMPADISCTSAEDCWATFNTRKRAGVIATTNGGRSWHEQSLPGRASMLGGISCTADGACVAIGSGSRMGCCFSPLAFASTKDGGATWSLKQLAVSAGDGQTVLAYMYGVSCAAARDCWAVGQRSNCPRGRCVGNLDTIEATRDGGATWHLQPAPRTGDLFWAISCPNTHDCWTAGRTGEGPGASGVIIATTDGGAHWHQQPAPSETRTFTGISCTSAADCTATGWNGSVGVVVKTSDGGHRWHLVAALAGTSGLGEISCSARGYCLASASIGYGRIVTGTVAVN